VTANDAEYVAAKLAEPWRRAKPSRPRLWKPKARANNEAGGNGREIASSAPPAVKVLTLKKRRCCAYQRSVKVRVKSPPH
jgi:hypothetical protein